MKTFLSQKKKGRKKRKEKRISPGFLILLLLPLLSSNTMRRERNSFPSITFHSTACLDGFPLFPFPLYTFDLDLSSFEQPDQRKVFRPTWLGTCIHGGRPGHTALLGGRLGHRSKRQVYILEALHTTTRTLGAASTRQGQIYILDRYLEQQLCGG